MKLLHFLSQLIIKSSSKVRLLSLGVSICLERVSIKTLNLDTGRELAGLDSGENFDTFKILVISMVISNTVLLDRDQDLSRLIETY
jgi:hypothetical protein